MNRWVYFAGLFFLTQLIFSIAFAKEFRYDSHGKRDPFFLSSKVVKTIAEDTGAVTNLKLEGVVMDPKGRSLAVVNGEMVGEGDRVGGLVVVRHITNQGVEFENNGKTFTIPIVPKDQ